MAHAPPPQSESFNDAFIRGVLSESGLSTSRFSTRDRPVYAAPLYLQRGHGIGNLFGSVFRWVRPLLWSGAKAVGRHTLRTGGKILTDIAVNKSPDVSASDIVSKHVTESAQNLISKLRGRGRKRSAAAAIPKNKRKKQHQQPIPAKRARVIKRDIFS
jgi:hypothetical protein